MCRAFIWTIAIIAAIPAVDVAAQAVPAAPAEPEFGVRATLELGFLGVLAHDIQLGRDGSRIDYPGEAGQNNLYLFARVQAELDIWRQHRITFLYQPLELDSRSTLSRDLRIDGLDYAQGTPVRFRYGFPFYRVGWSYDVLDARHEELSFGLALQLRNATIEFESTDGSLYRSRQDVGPVPLLRSNGRFALAGSWWIGWELDGFYAPISVLNGSDTEVVGAIVDASVRVGVRVVPHLDTFVNVRYLGGGATGQGDATVTSDGWQSNWLHFLTVSIGATIDSRP
jgi:hypothetical protein